MSVRRGRGDERRHVTAPSIKSADVQTHCSAILQSGELQIESQQFYTFILLQNKIASDILTLVQQNALYLPF